MKTTIFSLAVVVACVGCPPPEQPIDGGPPPGATVHLVKGGDGHGAITSNPEGIDCDNDCDGPQDATFVAGATKVTLSAVAARDALFANWNCEGTKNGTPLQTVVVDDAVLDIFDDPDPKGIDITCTATFKQLWTILVLNSGSGTGHITGTALAPDGVNKRIDCPTKCTAGYFAGEQETLTATADADSVFVTWKLDCQGTDPATFTLEDDENCEAHFCPLADPNCP